MDASWTPPGRPIGVVYPRGIRQTPAMSAPDAEIAGLVARLGDALGAAVRPSSLDAELRQAVRRIRGLYGAAACSFAQLDPSGETLRFVAADGAGADLIIGTVLPVGRGIAGWAVLSGEAIQVREVQRDSRFARDVAESTDYVPSVILAAPVTDAAGETAGVLEVLDPRDAGEQGEPGAGGLAVLEVLAGQLASTIRLAASFDAVGTGLLRSLADPQGSGDFDQPLMQLAEGSGLGEVAAAFRQLAAAGPHEQALARTLLDAVAAYAGRR